MYSDIWHLGVFGYGQTYSEILSNPDGQTNLKSQT